MPDVVIASTATQLKWQGGTAPTFVVEAAGAQLTPEGVPVINGGGPFRNEWATTVNVGGYVVVPSVTLPSGVSYIAYFQKANAYDSVSRIPFSVFGPNQPFYVPEDTPTTWEEVDAARGGSLPSASGDRTVSGDLTVGGTGTFGGAVTAPSFSGDGLGLTNTDARKLRGRLVSSSAPSAGQSIAWNDLTQVWEPTSVGGSIAGGNATQVQGRAVSATAPTEGQGLIYSASAWRPGTPGPFFNVKNYLATGDGTTDDTTFINDAIAAFNAAGRGVLYFPAGDYKVTAGLTAITAVGLVMGDGHTDSNSPSIGTYVSRVKCTSATAVLFTVNAQRLKFRDITLLNSAATTPTAGAGIKVTNGSNAFQQVDYDSISVERFYDCVDIEVGNNWVMFNSWIRAPVRYGLHIRNTIIADTGGWALIKTSIVSDTGLGIGIRITSCGSGKIIATNVSALAQAVVADLSSGTTGILFIGAGSAFEDNTGIPIEIGGWHSVTICGVEFGMWNVTNIECIKFTDVKRSTISNVVFNAPLGGNYAIGLTNCKGVKCDDSTIVNGGYTVLYSVPGTWSPDNDTGYSRNNVFYPLTLLNSWANAAGGLSTAGVTWMGGAVELKGNITGGANGSVIAVLPNPFKPTQDMNYRVYSAGGVGAGIPYVNISASSGNITVGNVTGTGLLSLDGIRYVP